MRLWAWARGASLLWAGTCVAFVLLNLICLPWARQEREPGPDLAGWDDAALQRAYPGMTRKDVAALLEETWRRRLAYEPFTLFREAPVRGRFVNVHEAGFRFSVDQGPWPAEKTAFNVFVFGGSTAFGYGVADAETLASHLAQSLGAAVPGMRARVYNFGRGAYYSTQERLLFEQLLREGATPALAIFLDGLNEFFYPHDEPAHAERLRAAFEEQATDLVPALRRTARALPAVRLLLDKPAAPEAGEPAEHGLEGGFAPGVERELDRYVANKRLVESVAREHSVSAVFVWQPIPMYAYTHRPSDGPVPGVGVPDRWRRRYESVAARRGKGELGKNFVWCAELGAGTPGPLYVDRVHYSGLMNRRIAEAVVSALSERGLIPRP